MFASFAASFKDEFLSRPFRAALVAFCSIRSLFGERAVEGSGARRNRVGLLAAGRVRTVRRICRHGDRITRVPTGSFNLILTLRRVSSRFSSPLALSLVKPCEAGKRWGRTAQPGGA